MARDSDSESEILRNIARNPHPQRLTTTRDDSSSSRESSPDRQKRSFSPTSDDGNMEMPPIADDDTPPPPDRPIIREAVAFSSAFGTTSIGASTSLNTYQASPGPPASRSTQFLPGQSVPAKPKRPPKPKQRKNKEAFSTQTGRFRLKGYTPTLPTSSTPTPNPTLEPTSSTPYSATNSYYPMSQTPATVNVGTSPATIQSLSSVGYVPPPVTPHSTNPTPTNMFSSAFAPQPRAQTSATSNGNVSDPRSERPTGVTKAPLTKSKSTSSSSRSHTANSNSRSNSTSARSQSQTPQPQSHTMGSSSSTYYRRNYDLQTELDRDTISKSPTIPSRSSPSPAASPQAQPGARTDRPSAKYSQPSRPSSRMVTILITDIRSGIEDHQLAEVIVPLKEADPHNPEYGFWANAQEVVDKLQSTPSRIEGSARAYTMRGKYRQFFLRVRESGSYEAAPANVGVTAQRTLDVVVEAVPQPGALPAPPRIPRDLQPSPEPDSFSPSNYTRGSDEQFHHGQKRYHSPSVETDDRRTVAHDATDSRASSLPHSPKDNTIHRLSKKSKILETEDEISDSDAELFVTPLAQGREWEYDSPDSDDEPEQVYNLIVKRVDPLLQTSPNWTKVFRAKTNLPRVSAYLQIYRVLQEMFDKYQGRRVPFKSNRNLRIERSHIIKAMQIEEDPDRLSSDCTETLKLLALYGPEGRRLQDRRVEDMINDDSQPEYNAKPQKRFLRLLRDIDQKWNESQSQNKGPASSASPVPS